jgi:hypothetical protein
MPSSRLLHTIAVETCPGAWYAGAAFWLLTILLPARVLLKPCRPCNKNSLCADASYPGMNQRAASPVMSRT